jgi:hypothetical protein
MLALVNWCKTSGVLVVIALWLSSGLLAHTRQQHLPAAADELSAGYAQATLNSVQVPAILPVQPVRLPGLRPGGPVPEGPPLFLSCRSVELAPRLHLQPDATGLAPVALAQNWQFLLRAAPFPRSPSRV